MKTRNKNIQSWSIYRIAFSCKRLAWILMMDNQYERNWSVISYRLIKMKDFDGVFAVSVTGITFTFIGVSTLWLSSCWRWSIVSNIGGKPWRRYKSSLPSSFGNMSRPMMLTINGCSRLYTMFPIHWNYAKVVSHPHQWTSPFHRFWPMLVLIGSCVQN